MLPASKNRPRNERSLHPQLKSSRPSQYIRAQAYDSDSGQVYHETEITFNKRQTIDWIGEYQTPALVKRQQPNATGTRSLYQSAAIKCAREFRDFWPEHFDEVPWSVAEDVWDKITSAHLQSFHAWRTLATVYNNGNEFGAAAFRYHLNVKQPTLQAKEYYQALTSPDCRWLTALRITPRQMHVPDIVAVASISNIAVLDMSDGQLFLENRLPVFDERILRTWSELASSGRAFQHLRAILFGWQDNVRDWIFKYLNTFPSLCFIAITDCNNISQKNRTEWEPMAKEHGWEAQHAKRSAKSLRPLLDDKEFQRGTISNYYYHSEGLFGELSNRRKPKHSARLPLVECWLGNPKPWMHIMDEFPGTRTVWFANIKTKSRPEFPGGLETTKRARESSDGPHSTPLSPARSVPRGLIARKQVAALSAANLLAEFGR